MELRRGTESSFLNYIVRYFLFGSSFDTPKLDYYHSCQFAKATGYVIFIIFSLGQVLDQSNDSNLNIVVIYLTVFFSLRKEV